MRNTPITLLAPQIAVHADNELTTIGNGSFKLGLRYNRVNEDYGVRRFHVV